MTDTHQVIIAGGGPAGLTLAAELALAGLKPCLLERRPDQNLAGSRAGGLHARTLEIFDQRGIVDRFLAQGQVSQVTNFRGTTLDISHFPTRHNYGLALWQNQIERILADWVGELGIPIHYGKEVVQISQEEAGVVVTLADGQCLRAQYLVGCDGGRSQVRKLAGIEFPGWEATVSNLIAEVEMGEEPPWGFRHDALGMHAIGKMDDGQRVRVMLTEKQLQSGAQPGLDELREGLIAVYGSDFGVHSPTWISRFSDAVRQAASYRQGRILLAGDAAHVHPPDGGQGLQLGVQDAVNLGWKLAQVVRQVSPDSLLDTYQAERHPVGARALRLTLGQVALRSPDLRTSVLREMMGELLSMEEPRDHYAGMLSGLSIHYDLGPGHPLLGRRVPDLDLEGGGRLYRHLHQARPLLLNLGAPGRLDLGSWSARVSRLDDRSGAPWSLPVLGPVDAPSAVLVRPDGYVAWVGEGSDSGLEQALSTWFGAA